MPIISTGSFKIIPVAVTIGGTWRHTGFGGTHNPAAAADVLHTLRPYSGIANAGGNLCSAFPTFGGAASFAVLPQPLVDGLDTFLNGSSSPTSYDDLPPGWTPTSLQINVSWFRSGDFTAQVLARFGDDATEGAPPFNYPFPYPHAFFPTKFDLYSIGWHCRIVTTATGGAGIGSGANPSDGHGYLVGAYAVIHYWWRVPTVDACGDAHTPRYVLAGDQPPDTDDGGVFAPIDPADPDAAPTPTITSLTPDHGPTTNGTAITIRGEGFGDGAQVYIGGVVPLSSVVVVSAEEITGVIPTFYPLPTAGPVDVVVINADDVTSEPAVYTYEDPVLAIVTVSPDRGPTAGGTPITITGRGFQGVTPGTATVTIGGLPASGVAVESDELLTALTPVGGIGPAAVIVTNTDGTTDTLTNGYSYEAAPPPASLSYRTPSGAAAPGQVRLKNPPPTISQTIGQPWTASFTTELEPVGLSSVAFWAFGVPLFEGIVTGRTARTEGKVKRTVWDATATNYAYLLSRRYPVGDWTATSGTDVILALMAGWGSGFSSAGVEAALGPVTVSFDGSTNLWAAITEVCEKCSAKVFLAGTTLHAFTVDSGYAPPVAVTDANPDLLYPSSGQAVTIEYDYSQVRNRVTVRGAEGLAVMLDDAASIAMFGVCEYPINDNTLTTSAELTTRAQVELAAYAQPIPTITYATRDLLTMAGKTVAVAISSPAIVGTFVIQSVRIDQLELVLSGKRPRFTVTAAPASAPMARAAGGLGIMQTVVDLAATKKQQPKLDGAVVSTPGGSTEIPAGSIPASKLAGCIPSSALTPTGVTAGTYGDPAHLVGFEVDSAGRLIVAAEDPVPVVKTDGSQPWTADQSMGGNQITNVAPPIDGTDAVNKDYVDAAIAAIPGGGIGGSGTVGTIAKWATAATLSDSILTEGVGLVTIAGVLRVADGAVGAPAYSYSGDPDTGHYHIGVQGWAGFTSNGAITHLWGPNEYRLGSIGQIDWSGSSNPTLAAADLILLRDAAGVLAQRNGANAQTFRLYGTYTSASSYERLNVIAQAGAAFDIVTAALGTGTVRPLRLGAGAAQWAIQAPTGHFFATADNAYNIGASGANRPATIYAGTGFVGSGAGLTNLNASNLATGLVALARGGFGTDMSGLMKGYLPIGFAAGVFTLLLAGTDGHVLTADSSAAAGVKWAAAAGGGGTVGGSGTAGTLPKWATTTTLGNSIVTEATAFIGINQAVPAARLHLNNAAASTPILLLDRDAAGPPNTNINAIRFRTGSAADWDLQGGDLVGQNFSIYSHGTAVQALTILRASGNVGIGDTNPTAKLTVAGNVTLTGLLTASGFGQHAFAATGTGAQSVVIRNTSAGTANYAALFLGNNASATLAYLRAFASDFSTSGPSIANGAQIVSEGAGGLSLCASNPAGTIGFYPGGTIVRGLMHISGGLSWGHLGDPGVGNVSIVGTLTCGAFVQGSAAKGAVFASTGSGSYAGTSAPAANGYLLLSDSAQAAGAAWTNNLAQFGIRTAPIAATYGISVDAGATYYNALAVRYSAGNPLFLVGIEQSSAYPWLGLNAIQNAAADTQSYAASGFGAARLRFNAGANPVLGFQVAASGTAGATITWVNAFGIHTNGDWLKGGNIMDSVGTPTIASGFGTGPTIAGNDYAMLVTTGSGMGSPPQSVVINFGRTFATAPVVVASCQSSGSAAIVVLASATTTQLTITITNVLVGAGLKVYALVRGY